MKRVDILCRELEHIRNNTEPEHRMKELGHAKDLQDKLYNACQGVKTTYENLPKLVERME